MTPKQIIDSELTKARTDLARSRHQREAMAIAQQRGELIEKRLVERQASYIFLCLRQAILNFPPRYARRMVGLPDERAREVLTGAAHEFLNEIANFDTKAISPDWLATLEADGQPTTGKPIHPSSGQEIKAEQRKAKIRRRQKTETMRKLRAKAKIA